MLSVIINWRPTASSFAHAYQWLMGKLQGIPHEIRPPGMPVRGDRVLVIGEDAVGKYFPNIPLHLIRGSLRSFNGKPGVATYHPQDAMELKGQDEPDTYRFWIEWDLKKITGQVPVVDSPQFSFNPPLTTNEVIEYLSSAKGPLVVDIECERLTHKLTCIGVKDGDERQIVIPVYYHDGSLYYGEIPKIMVALYRAMKRCKIICHNALFDLFVLAWKNRIACGRDIWDTMLVNHRLFPEIQKSLGHCISQWTWLAYHKDMALDSPMNTEQSYQLWEYNERDTFGTWEVYKAQNKYLETPEGREYQASCRQANELVYPYLLTQLVGIKVNEMTLASRRMELERKMDVLVRVCRILSKGKIQNPTSSKQLGDYFFKYLGLIPPGKTPKGKEAVGRKELALLWLKYKNPIMKVAMTYRELQKAFAMLHFVPYEGIRD